ncbi:MAG: hypothetical protein V4724_21890 [Pseudomonadota bacterium]
MRAAIFAVMVLAGLGQPAAQAEDVKAERYVLKDDPHTGSSIRRESSYSTLPFDKPYRELSEEQQRVVKAEYVSMGEGDEPPFPAKGTAHLFRALHEGNRKLKDAGVLHLAAVVDATGAVTEVKIYETPSQEMARFMAGVLSLEQYKPALCKGVPCTQEYSFKVSLHRKY